MLVRVVLGGLCWLFIVLNKLFYCVYYFNVLNAKIKSLILDVL